MKWEAGRPGTASLLSHPAAQRPPHMPRLVRARAWRSAAHLSVGAWVFAARTNGGLGQAACLCIAGWFRQRTHLPHSARVGSGRGYGHGQILACRRGPSSDPSDPWSLASDTAASLGYGPSSVVSLLW